MDLEPSEDDSEFHIIGDAIDFLQTGCDLLIAFPPCTHLASSGARWFESKKQEQDDAVDFARILLDIPLCPRVAMENPVGILSTRIRKPDQIIQPYMFGHPESKRTCLWLKGLPKLQPTNILAPRPRWQNQRADGQNTLGESKARAKLRGRTYTGIAEAMAEQWGCL